MTNETLVALLTAGDLQEKLRVALHKAGIATVETLQDRDRIKIAADFLYDSFPLPARLAIKRVVGRDGFDQLVFGLCGSLAKVGSVDCSNLDREAIGRHLVQFVSEMKRR